MNAIDTEVMMMNKIIIEAIEHGGDPGGAYFCNAKGLREMLEMWLRMKSLDKEYKVSKSDYELIIPIDEADVEDWDEERDRVWKTINYKFGEDWEVAF